MNYIVAGLGNGLTPPEAARLAKAIDECASRGIKKPDQESFKYLCEYIKKGRKI